jgi:hypothetical protein
LTPFFFAAADCDRIIVVIVGHVETANVGFVERHRRIEPALAIVLRLDVADVQEAVATDAEINEGRLDGRLHVDYAAFVDIADVVIGARPLDVERLVQPTGALQGGADDREGTSQLHDRHRVGIA